MCETLAFYILSAIFASRNQNNHFILLSVKTKKSPANSKRTSFLSNTLNVSGSRGICRRQRDCLFFYSVLAAVCAAVYLSLIIAKPTFSSLISGR
jgi:hypothetical protein